MSKGGPVWGKGGRALDVGAHADLCMELGEQEGYIDRALEETRAVAGVTMYAPASAEHVVTDAGFFVDVEVK